MGAFLWTHFDGKFEPQKGPTSTPGEVPNRSNVDPRRGSRDSKIEPQTGSRGSKIDPKRGPREGPGGVPGGSGRALGARQKSAGHTQ